MAYNNNTQSRSRNETRQADREPATGIGPVKKFQAGAICAAVWNNTHQVDGEERDFLTVTIERRYKDKNDEWQSSNSFAANDLARLEVVTRQALEYLVTPQHGEEDAA